MKPNPLDNLINKNVEIYVTFYNEALNSNLQTRKQKSKLVN